MNTEKRSPLEVADIVREYGAEYRQTHRLDALHQGVLNAIQNCRTQILGGHIDQCDDCGHQAIVMVKFYWKDFKPLFSFHSFFDEVFYNQ